MMTDEEKLQKYADRERYKINGMGAVIDLQTGRGVDLIASLNPHSITKANAAAMHRRRREVGEQAALDEANRRVLEKIEAGKLVLNIDNHDTLFVRALVRQCVDGLLDGKKSGREKEAYAGIVFKLLGWNSVQRMEIEKTNVYSVDDETREAMLQLAAFLQDSPPPAIEGTVTDAE